MTDKGTRDREQAVCRVYHALETTGEAIALLDESGEFAYANETYAETFGYEPEDLLGEPLAALGTGDLSERCVPSAAGHGRVTETVTCTRSAGETVRIELSFTPTDDGDVLSLVRETITEPTADRNEAEVQLDAVNSAESVGTWVWDIADDRLVADASFARLFGVQTDASPVQVPGEAFIEGIHEADRERVETMIAEAIDTDGEFTAEYRVRTVDDEVRWVSSHGTVEYDADGTPVRFPGVVTDITPLQEAISELQEREKRLRAVFDGTYEFIGLLDPDGTVLDANRAALEWDGASREKAIGLPLWETPWFTNTPGIPERVRRDVARAAAGEFVRYELSLQDASGEVTAFDFSLHPVTDEHGEVVYIVPEGRDISERKRREERDQFLLWLDQALQPLSEPEEIMATASELLCEQLEADRCAYVEAGGKNRLHIIGDYTRGDAATPTEAWTIADFGSEALRSMRENTVYVVDDIETDERLTDDARDAYEYLGARSAVFVPLHKDGRFTAGMAIHQETPREWRTHEIGLATTVAQRCWESLQRARTMHKLRDSEERLQLALEAGEMGAWELDLQTEDSPVRSPRHDEIFGYDEPLDDWSLERFLEHVHPDDRERVQRRFENALETGEWEFECRITRADDERRWITAHGEFFYDDAGEPVRSIGIVGDITDRKERERKLERQNKRLESFASMLAHELRNPLGIAQIYLKNARRGDESAFEQVEVAHERIEEMINVLLVLAERGESTVDPESVELGEIATEVWETLSASPDQLVVETDVVLAVEPHHLRHILENLFENALDHGSAPSLSQLDGDRVDPTTDAHNDDVTVRLGELEDGFYVADDGRGIPDSKRDRIFEAGFTTDTNGIGLGLTFIGQLADAYGWDCRATESESGGARFEFSNVEITADE